MIRESGEFVINLVSKELTRAMDWCGVRSGRDFDKFAETGLTPVPSEKVKCPSIEESPISLECRVKDIKEMPTHDDTLRNEQRKCGKVYESKKKDEYRVTRRVDNFRLDGNDRERESLL